MRQIADYSCRLDVHETDPEKYPLIQSSPGTYLGIIAGALIDATGNGIEELPKAVNPNTSYNNNAFFFYSGTAPAPIEISFTITPIINDSTKYITTPCSFISNTKKYNTITIESEDKQEL